MLENPIIRWAIAFLYLGISLFLLVVVGDLPRVDQIIMIITCTIGFLVVPIALKGYVNSTLDT